MAGRLCRMDDNNLLGGIYDAALNQSLWPGVLDSLCQMVDCRAGAILHAEIESVRVTLVGETGLDPEISGRVPEIFSDPAGNPFLQKMPLLEPGVPISRQHLIDDDAFERNRIYTDFFEPQDLYHDVTTPMVVWPNEAVGMFLTRSRGNGPLDHNDSRILQPWIPHVQRALRINRELDMQRASHFALAELLDQISCGVALVNADGNVIIINEAAERIVEAADGLSYGNGRLAAASRQNDTALNDAVATATAGKGGGSLLIKRPSGARAYPAFILPLPRAGLVKWSRAPVAAILISDPESTMEPHVRAAARLYGLSPAETTVAVEVSRGLGRTNVAAKLGISGHTVKTHLGRIFAKTGTSGQVDLARLLESVSNLRYAPDK